MNVDGRSSPSLVLERKRWLKLILCKCSPSGRTRISDMLLKVLLLPTGHSTTLPPQTHTHTHTNHHLFVWRTTHHHPPPHFFFLLLASHVPKAIAGGVRGDLLNSDVRKEILQPLHFLLACYNQSKLFKPIDLNANREVLPQSEKKRKARLLSTKIERMVQ